MDKVNKPMWVPAFIAFNAVRRHYQNNTAYSDEYCWNAANEMLLRRLKAGQLPSRAANIDLELEDLNDPDETSPFKKEIGQTHIVPVTFWELMIDCKPFKQEVDWAAGDFACDTEIWTKDGLTCNHTFKSVVMGLEVDAAYLPRGIIAAGEFLTQQLPYQADPQRSGGRPPANWWPDFAEELAVYIHENGLPPGDGHDGQSALLDAVFARLTERGKAEPGRSTVQPVVNAVMRRIRPAGY